MELLPTCLPLTFPTQMATLDLLGSRGTAQGTWFACVTRAPGEEEDPRTQLHQQGPPFL